MDNAKPLIMRGLFLPAHHSSADDIHAAGSDTLHLAVNWALCETSSKHFAEYYT